MDETITTGRLAHDPVDFGFPVATVPAPTTTRRPALALTAEGPRRADLIAWAGAHRDTLSRMRLLAPSGIGALLDEQCGLTSDPLRSGTIGPTATASLAAAGDIDAMIAFSDPIELRPGDTTTRSLTRLAVFWDIPIAGNRATADLLLATIATANPLPAPVDGPGDTEPRRGAVSLWTVRATVDDVPGRLAILAASLARRAINILSVQVHLTPEGPVDELLVAASPVLSAADLTAAIVDGGARTPQVAAADAHALVDAPTRALALATRIVRRPEDLASVLTSLLPGACLAWRAEPPEGHEDSSTQLWLTDPAGGGFLLTRPAAPFTPAESARAYAMIDVATVATIAAYSGEAQAPVDSWQLLLADGREVVLRRATPDDVEGVADLHARCSLTSRLRRYLAGLRCPGEATLARLLSPDAGYSLVVEDPSGRIVAMANLMWDHDVPELALLVEDEWQERRLGTVLARRLVAAATAGGVAKVKAVVHVGNTPMVRIMKALGLRLHREYDAGLLTLIAALHPAITQDHVL
jgi:methylglyoxal synthase